MNIQSKEDLEQYLTEIDKQNEKCEQQRQKEIRKTLLWARLKKALLKIS